jgi:signal transduction histidine kinase
MRRGAPFSLRSGSGRPNLRHPVPALPNHSLEIVPLPTLRRELISAFALVFASALAVVLVGVALIYPNMPPQQTALYLTLLLLADIAIFTVFGRYLLERRLVSPLEQMIDRIETISRGDYTTRLAEAESQELARLATAVNHMAERLIADQGELAANIRSLNETNRALTEARDAMVRAEKMASVGRLGAGIAHEVGNPLGAILGYLGILGRHVQPADRDLVAAAEREAHRIDRIVRGLLEYARPRETRTQSTDVNVVVRESLELLRTQGRFTVVDLREEIEPELPPVLADPYQLQQVLVNLFVNATDALAEAASPRLVVRTSARAYAAPRVMPARRKDDPPGIDYSHRRRFHQSRTGREDPVTTSGRVVEISVQDNGPGVPPELIDQIFEPFVTTKEPGKGTGLGLAVCARLVESMGGSIRADTLPGEGAIFTVILPALVPELSESPT